MSRWKTAVAFIMIASTGCAHIGLGPPQVESRKTVSAAVKPVHRWGDATAVGALDGKTLTVKVVRQCFKDDVEFQTVETTTRRERLNESKALDWTAGIAGVALIGVGAVAVATPSTFAGSGSGSGGSPAPGSGSSGSGSGASTGGIVGAGVAMVAVGIALGVIPIVDAARASGSTKEVSTQVVPGATVMHTACGSEPYPSVAVMGAVGTSKRLYGRTDATGELHVNLWDQVPADAITGPSAALTLQLLIDDKPAGQVDISSLPGAFEETSWQQLNDPMSGDGGVSGCNRDVVLIPMLTAPGAEAATLWNISSCAALVRFTHLFPNGRHGAEANDLLSKFRARGEGTLQAVRAAADRARLEAGQQAAAREVAEKKAKEHGACVAKCRSVCSGDSSCVATCAHQNCS